LMCPKCLSRILRSQLAGLPGCVVHSYERNGVLVDQCVECRGIFLDRGELES
jgi:Zn-finger nucleic acid-binding protein